MGAEKWFSDFRSRIQYFILKMTMLMHIVKIANSYTHTHTHRVCKNKIRNDVCISVYT